MPELPDLEAIRDYLNARVRGQRVVSVSVRRPIVLPRVAGPVPEFIATLTGAMVATRGAGESSC